MTKDEINKKIFQLQSDEEIIAFVNERIAELEANSIETTVGQGYTDTFREYISQKNHYKAAADFKDEECPDLVYDDMEPYIELVKEIKEHPWYNELTLFSIIFYKIYHYLPSEDFGFERALTYKSHVNKKLSIKTIRERECAFCSEKAGMAHNMFKFLGMDSELACGYRDNELHAFNIIYPNGYENEPMVLYDPSFFVSFIKDNSKRSYGYFKALKRDEYERLINGQPLKLDLTKTEQIYRQLYGFNGSLDDYTFDGELATYTIGINKIKEDIQSI